MMILHDISKGVFRSKVYPGDPKPSAKAIKSISNGDEYNLSQFTICPHTGTHIDAPLHFIDDGDTIDKMDIRTFYGKCTVITVDGILTGADMDRILARSRKRILFRSKDEMVYLSSSAAQVIADNNTILVGTEALSIATSYEEEKTHRILLENDVAILEGLNLSNIKDGEYEICAFPIKVEGLEAAPCRAVLFEQEKGI